MNAHQPVQVQEIDPLRYSMVIAWSDEDDAFVVTVPELPGCVSHGATYPEAARQGEDAIATWLATARAWNDPIPPPRRFDDLKPSPLPVAGSAARQRRRVG